MLAGLDIAMDNTIFMGIIKGAGDRADNPDYFREGQKMIVLAIGRQVRTVQKLHGHVGDVVILTDHRRW